jgi:hypothetical protein
LQSLPIERELKIRSGKGGKVQEIRGDEKTEISDLPEG